MNDTMDLSLLNAIWPRIRKADADLLREQRTAIANYKKRFLALPTEKFRKAEKLDWYEMIVEAYSNLALFPDKSIIAKFREIGFNTTFLRWFIHLSDILTEFGKIEKSGHIKVLRPYALRSISSHIAVKVRFEVIDWIGYVTTYKHNPETSLLYVNFLKLYRQRQIIRKKPGKYKDAYSTIMHTILDKIETAFSGIIEPEKFVKDFTKGKSEGFWLRLMVDSIIRDETVSKRKFYIELYNLVRLIVKDYEMLTETEFNDRNYEIDWNTYRYRRVQQIIDKK